MDMTPDEYKNLRRNAEVRQADQRDEDRRNRLVTSEMEKDRKVQEKVLLITKIGAFAAIAAAILSFIALFK